MSQKTHKVCSRCRVLTPLTDFYRDSGRSDGIYHRCKECERKRQPRKKQDKQVKAGIALRSAVKNGRVTKWPVCAMPDCSKTNVEAHHPDYDNKLGVTWLCVEHHQELHKQAKEFV